MPSCCRTCDHREHAMHTISSTPTLLDICLVTLTFKTPVSTTNSKTYIALNEVLSNITDSAESTSHPTTFTTWSPCLSDPKTVVILTTARETCSSATSPVFSDLLKHLSHPPKVLHVYLDYSVLSLAASSPEERIPCDIIVLSAPNPGVAGAIGKRFGWDPKRSSLSSQMEAGAAVAFSRPGDLIRDFWAWAELHPDEPVSPSSSVGSGYESAGNAPGLISTNSDEKNMALFYAQDEERRHMEDETLVMMFQWSSHTDADRFKHPLQRSYGQNGQEVGDDMWDRHVAHPVRQLKGVGAVTETYKLELRGVEPRIGIGPDRPAVRERSGSRRISIMASGLGEKVSGFWR